MAIRSRRLNPPNASLTNAIRSATVPASTATANPVALAKKPPELKLRYSVRSAGTAQSEAEPSRVTASHAEGVSTATAAGRGRAVALMAPSSRGRAALDQREQRNDANP